MKFDIKDDKIIAHLYYMININNKENLEIYLRKLIKKITRKYKIIFKGFYQVKIYLNKFYGTIVEIINEDIDYIFNEINMEINVSNNSKMLCELEYDYLYDELDQVYKLDDKFYVEIKENILQIIEKGNIIYGDNVLNVLKKCKKVNL